MGTSRQGLSVVIDGEGVAAADAGEALRVLRAAVAGPAGRVVRWRIEGDAGPLLWGQVYLPAPDGEWLAWWTGQVGDALLPAAADPLRDVRPNTQDGPEP